MAKVIAEKAADGGVVPKQVEIKHTKVMKNASGNNVTEVDWIETKGVDEAISQAEAQLADAQAKVTELEEDIAEYKKIKG